MKAIITKYHGATNTRGSRISATAEGGNRVSIPYPHELNSDAAHKLAAVMLCKKMNWATELCGGGMPDGATQCWVFVDNLVHALAMAEATVKRLERHAPGSANGTLSVINDALQPYSVEGRT